MERELATYFQHMWGIDVDQQDLSTIKFPTFEEALGLLELAKSRGESFRGLGRNATLGKELRDHLVSLIAVYLERKLRTVEHCHLVLVGQLRSQGRLEQTAFVSLNYDILIDNALLMQGATGIDYAITFNTHDISRRSTAIPLLKLHGSLNWLYCPTCNALDHYPGGKIAAHLIEAPHRSMCDRCGESRVPIIIPPTFFKVMSNFYLQQIWKRAEEELKRADRFVFCGYSFPDADIHIKYLLKRAEVNRMGEAPEVFILNRPDERPVDTWENPAEKERYLRFFRRRDIVRWTNLSFQEFAANPQLVEDQTRWR